MRTSAECGWADSQYTERPPFLTAFMPSEIGISAHVRAKIIYIYYHMKCIHSSLFFSYTMAPLMKAIRTTLEDTIVQGNREVAVYTGYVDPEWTYDKYAPLPRLKYNHSLTLP